MSLKKALTTHEQTFDINAGNSPMAFVMLLRSYAGILKKNGIDAYSVPMTDEFLKSAGMVAEWVHNRPTCGLLICGEVGNGKTTMVEALTNLYAVRCNKLMTNVTALHIADLYRTGDTDGINAIKNSLMLSIDDLGTEAVGVKSWGNEISPVTDVIYHRYAKRMMTVVTTNMAAFQIRDRYGDRIADRFREMMTVVPFLDKSYRGGGER